MVRAFSARQRRGAASHQNGEVVQLGQGARGLRGVVTAVGGESLAHSAGKGGLERAELERRLLEIGFVEGAVVEILHEGAIGRDPIGVKLDDMRVALRRREANAVLVRIDDGTCLLQAAE